jgi:hypothetical protein
VEFRVALTQKCIHQSGFSMVNMSDDSYIPKVFHIFWTTTNHPEQENIFSIAKLGKLD